jgi:hypothetical protein
MGTLLETTDACASPLAPACRRPRHRQGNRAAFPKAVVTSARDTTSFHGFEDEANIARGRCQAPIFPPAAKQRRERSTLCCCNHHTNGRFSGPCDPVRRQTTAHDRCKWNINNIMDDTPGRFPFFSPTLKGDRGSQEGPLLAAKRTGHAGRCGKKDTHIPDPVGGDASPVRGNSSIDVWVKTALIRIRLPARYGPFCVPK